jgi:hypothetical protein
MDANIVYVYTGPDTAHERDTGPEPGQGHDAGLDAARASAFPDARSGCVEVAGSGELAMCPGGMVATGSLCCPCSAGDCGNAVCCDSDVCAGAPACAGVTCGPLPASCGGMVNADCDDFPEDCDEPCCPCRNC